MTLYSSLSSSITLSSLRAWCRIASLSDFGQISIGKKYCPSSRSMSSQICSCSSSKAKSISSFVDLCLNSSTSGSSLKINGKFGSFCSLLYYAEFCGLIREYLFGPFAAAFWFFISILSSLFTISSRVSLTVFGALSLIWLRLPLSLDRDLSCDVRE